MYNRYIPQNDGTYCKKSIPDRQKDPPKPLLKEPIPKSPVPPSHLPVSPPSQPHRTYQCPKTSKQEPVQKIGSFLKQLLPADFGTEDLIVVLLLLLMAGDDAQERNSALLTLALYIFL